MTGENHLITSRPGHRILLRQPDEDQDKVLGGASGWHNDRAERVANKADNTVRRNAFLGW